MRTYRNIAEGIFDRMVLNTMRDADNKVNCINYNPALRLNDDAKYRLNYRIHMLTDSIKPCGRMQRVYWKNLSALLGC